ncbi:geranylgeranyl diphosphate synthase type II [Aequitasia blattaphilus]|uniref:Polyprenyl synthetase family protein n=1 Tax=Aequitasia blattaphilus TaxID=2949332 RepID=A0ABT1E5R1_9FIRM|nr:farnesyl diphosphate synthase [Aequitasia blattaphilus]MCP1101160.1 polyprenyl synthetase family protein [Aequitasia blattaphilus]MCR8613800.1 polyprenyl synthetase family protein [Aequitasia blattaphilus]
MNLNDFNIKVEKKTKDIEEILKSYLPEAKGKQKLIMEAMDYALMAGGKRLRPMILKEVYRMFGGTGKEVEAFMAALEMIHTYSLVHDDLPAMDNDEYRRGRKTTHIVYGEDMGILAGDALLNYAFETAFQAFDIAPENPNIGVALQILGKKAGVFGMIGGQVVDVKETGNKIDEETLGFIFKLKTAALLEAAMMIGAALAGQDKDTIQRMERVAENVGIAFQIQDDILDVTGTKELLGKETMSDAKNEKTTYVTLHGVECSKEMVEKRTKDALDELASFEETNEFLVELVKSLIYREK